MSVPSSMDEKIAESAVLDYVIFQMSSSDNSYEALISSNGIIEKLAHGPLDQLAVHLPNARALSGTSEGSFKLQPDECIKSSAWFTKFIVGRFLHIVNVPNVLKLSNEIKDEISQLEETRRFHVSLYAKDYPLHLEGREADISCLNDSDLTHQVKVETASSDATKNELLRALDLRLSTLKDDLAASFNHAAGATCSIIQIMDLATFSHHLGATELRNSLLKFFELYPNNVPFDIASNWLTSFNDIGNIKQVDVGKPSTTYVSPDKLAQAERQSSSETENGSGSSDGDSPIAERSRPIARSVTPRRSSSPMRRIQIGKSGSRRSTALAIKSLSYFPSKEKASSNRDADGSGGEVEAIEQLPKKPDINVSRMSVQDAINLFESKQKDQNADAQKRKTSEVSIGATKAVLRRWSSGMSDSINFSVQEKASDSIRGCSNLDSEPEEEKMENVNAEFSNPETERNVLLQGNTSEPVASYQVMETKGQASTAEWSVQKEAELNEMLVKMMESSKPTKYLGAKAVDADRKDVTDQKGGFYVQYKEKRDEKLRAENARKQAAKDAQLKAMHDTLARSKAAMSPKISSANVKPDAQKLSPKPRRNSSPPILSNKEVSKPSTKKLASKSLSPNPRSSLSSVPLKKACTPPSKISPGSSGSSATNRQKYRPSNSPSQASLRTEKPLQLPKQDNKSINTVQGEPIVEVKEGKQTKTVTNRSKVVKPSSPQSSEDSNGFSKPGFQNKHTKKSSVVPLESKPFLRKGSGTSTGIGHSISKAKDARVIRSADSSKSTGSHVQLEGNQCSASPSASTIKVIEDELVEPTNVVDETLAPPLDNDVNIRTAENVDGSLTLTENDRASIVEPQHEDMSISSAAWVDAENQEQSPSCKHEQQEVVCSPTIAPVMSSSPRIRHSLSQMLLADNSEQVIEWGNADNPPSLVYQKDAPKGFKRLLKFGRKGKVEGSSTGLGLSEGEEEDEESKATGRRSSDDLRRKSSHQTKGHRQTKLIVSENFDSGNSSRRSMDHRSVLDALSGSEKSREVHVSTAKATRSFFSLSTFRSSKFGGEAKPRR